MVRDEHGRSEQRLDLVARDGPVGEPLDGSAAVQDVGERQGVKIVDGRLAAECSPLGTCGSLDASG